MVDDVAIIMDHGAGRYTIFFGVFANQAERNELVESLES
jgi:hypothetical protein